MRAAYRTAGSVVPALAAVAVAFGAAWPSGVAAQGIWPPPDAPMSGSTEVVLGLGVSHRPSYPGSEERTTRALPLVAARWDTGWFAGVGGAGYRFNAGQPFSWGGGLSIDLGRDEDDATALRGMGDIPTRAEAGLFASWRLFGPVTLGSSLRYGSGDDRQGLRMDLSLRSAWPVAPNLRLTTGLVAGFANARSMRSLFGVDAAQSLRSGYAIYTPGSGLRDLSFQVGAMVPLGGKTSLMLGLDASRLMGDAVDSPITRRRNGLGAQALVSWRL